MQAEYDKICDMRGELQEEAQYNLECLRQVKDRFAEYLSSMAFFGI